jgi:hypothetical protein
MDEAAAPASIGSSCSEGDGLRLLVLLADRDIGGTAARAEPQTSEPFE